MAGLNTCSVVSRNDSNAPPDRLHESLCCGGGVPTWNIAARSGEMGIAAGSSIFNKLRRLTPIDGTSPATTECCCWWAAAFSDCPIRTGWGGPAASATVAPVIVRCGLFAVVAADGTCGSVVQRPCVPSVLLSAVSRFSNVASGAGTTFDCTVLGTVVSVGSGQEWSGCSWAHDAVGVESSWAIVESEERVPLFDSVSSTVSLAVLVACCMFESVSPDGTITCCDGCEKISSVTVVEWFDRP